MQGTNCSSVWELIIHTHLYTDDTAFGGSQQFGVQHLAFHMQRREVREEIKRDKPKYKSKLEENLSSNNLKAAWDGMRKMRPAKN